MLKVKSADKTGQQTLAGKPLLAKLGWGLVASNKKTFRHTPSPSPLAPFCALGSPLFSPLKNKSNNSILS